MILITSAKYVNPELQSEFGKVPPSFLTLGGKRLYEFQAKLFKKLKEKIVLSLPYGFKLTKFDKDRLSSLGINVLFIPEELNLGESIIYALNMNLPINDSLKILHGDTYFNYLDNIENSICISKVDSNYNWTFMVEDNIPFINITNYNKDELYGYIVNGYFNIKYPYILIQSIMKRGYSFLEGLQEYAKLYPFNAIKNKSWLDFGLVSSYFHSKKEITTERVFNTLVMKNGFVIKSSTFKEKLAGEIYWFNNFPQELSLYIPRFYSDKDGLSYKTEYLYSNTLAELYVFGNLPSYTWEQIFLSAKRFLTKLHTYETNNTNINFDFKQKTIDRLSEFSKKSNISINREWIYNGNKYPSLIDIIDNIDKYIQIKSNKFKFIHGDFCFSNIMYDFKSNEIKTFDPRGIDFKGKVNVYGDERYDFAKLMHSVIGLYDFIIFGFYDCKIDNYEIKFELYIPENIRFIQEVFLKVFSHQNRNDIYAIMIHLFLSMLPLHDDNKNRQEALLANVFRLYKEIKDNK